MRIINFLQEHKKTILLLVSILFFGLLLFFFSSLADNREQNKEPNETQTPSVTKKSTEIEDGIDIEGMKASSLDSKPGLISKEGLPGGFIKYIFSSSSLARNTVIIAKGDRFLYQRTALDPPVPVKSFTDEYGQPEKIIPGYLYGENSQIFVYPSQGLSLTVSSQTGNVLEKQVFPKTTIEKYKQKYEADLFIAE